MSNNSCKNCSENNFISDPAAGTTVCLNCGTVLEESTIVSEVNFLETSSGAAAVSGSFVGANATATRISGPHGRSSGIESSEITKQRSLQMLRNYQQPLSLPDSVISTAERHLILAYQYSFTKGRQIEHVIAVCLYMACKEAKTTHMLIDLADFLRINVFALGSTYLKWMKTLHWENKLLEPSIFIGRFVAMLEFGEDQNKIATDAARIAARFKEDWIHEGRRTAGICGAAIYLAAQMNNYRRSIQEIVQVAKIADTTIIKRLEEFSATPSANLTVGDFRVTKHPTEAADPPSFTRARVQEKEISEGQGSRTMNRRKRGQKRKRGDMEEDDQSYRSHTPSVRESSVASEPLFLPSNESQHEDEDQDASSTTRQEPISPRLLERGIFEGVAPLSTERIDMAGDRGAQAEVETERNEDNPLSTADHRIPDELVIDQAHIEEVREILESHAGKLALEDVRLTRESRRQEETTETVVGEEVEDNLLDLDEDELDGYLCGEAEAQMRERVWTELNLDYLRKLAAKRFQDQTGEELKPKKKRKTKTKQPFTPGPTAFESVRAMMETNKRFSKRINYNALKAALPDVVDEKEEDEEEEDFKMDEDVEPEHGEMDAGMRELKRLQGVRDDEDDEDGHDWYQEEV